MNTAHFTLHNTICAVALSLALLVGTTLPTVVDADDSDLSAKIAVLDFEVKDLTLNPTVEQEAKRAATIKPLLETMLKEQYAHDVKPLSITVQAQADKGAGYLFDRQAQAAALGSQSGADWVIAGRVHKASFLFVYFKALVINTKTSAIVAELVVEVKGPQDKLTSKGVESLALQIHDVVSGKGR